MAQVYINTSYPEIAKQWHPTKNGDLHPNNFTTGSNKKVWWLCAKKCSYGCKHEWEAVICSRTRVNGCGCPYCSNRKVCIHTSILTTHPDIAKEWHPTKNGTLKASDVCFGSGKKIWWLCAKKCPHGCIHEWETDVEHRTKKESGCPYCSIPQKRICKHSSIEFTHPHIAKDWHPTKNGNLLVSQVSYNSDRKVWWLCPNKCVEGCLHEYESTVGNRYIGDGCPFCSNHKICEHGSIQYTHPERAKYWHPTKNGDLLPSQVSYGSHAEVWWICPKKCPEGCLHEWKDSVKNYINNKECYWCSVPSKKVCEHITVSYMFPELMKQWHPTKNITLNPKEIKPGTNIRVWWICDMNTEHEWECLLTSRTKSLNPSGCPICKNKTEAKLLTYFKKLYPSIIMQLKLETCKNVFKLPFDFCIPELKIIIEIDGMQHFKQVSNWGSPEKAQILDTFKMNKALEAGYKVIRIFQEDVWNNDENWLDENLLPHIKSAERDFVFISSVHDMYDEHIKLFESYVEIQSSYLEDDIDIIDSIE